MAYIEYLLVLPPLQKRSSNQCLRQLQFLSALCKRRLFIRLDEEQSFGCRRTIRSRYYLIATTIPDEIRKVRVTGSAIESLATQNGLFKVFHCPRVTAHAWNRYKGLE